MLEYNKHNEINDPPGTTVVDTDINTPYGGGGDNTGG